MQPLELMKRVSMASNLNKFIFMTLSYKLNKGKERLILEGPDSCILKIELKLIFSFHSFPFFLSIIKWITGSFALGLNLFPFIGEGN